ncbi:unnamed protein product [Mytilus edulis]|uniref:Uncharacterized protein n=1 Tax=Mytilus edulis TaxID=6550 RepID=A0A8S3SQD8_MYTED|nr:unnamed protein product [Mytilus edulis]
MTNPEIPTLCHYSFAPRRPNAEWRGKPVRQYEIQPLLDISRLPEFHYLPYEEAVKIVDDLCQLGSVPAFLTTPDFFLQSRNIKEIQIANGSKRREMNLKYNGRTAKLTAWNGLADTVGGCHLQAGKIYRIKSDVPTNDFHDCRCYNASPSTTFELLEDREEDTGIIDGIVESVSFESNIIEVEDEYFNIPKNMLMAVFPSGQFVQNTNIRA